MRKSSFILLLFVLLLSTILVAVSCSIVDSSTNSSTDSGTDSDAAILEPVNTMFDATEELDGVKWADCYYGGNMAEEREQIIESFQDLKDSGFSISVTNRKVKVISKTMDSAWVSCYYDETITSSCGSHTEHWGDEFPMIKVDGKWYFNMNPVPCSEGP